MSYEKSAHKTNISERTTTTTTNSYYMTTMTSAHISVSSLGSVCSEVSYSLWDRGEHGQQQSHNNIIAAGYCAHNTLCVYNMRSLLAVTHYYVALHAYTV